MIKCFVEWPPTEEEQQKMEKQEVFTIKDTKSPLLHEYKKNVRICSSTMYLKHPSFLTQNFI